MRARHDQQRGEDSDDGGHDPGGEIIQPHEEYVDEVGHPRADGAQYHDGGGAAHQQASGGPSRPRCFFPFYHGNDPFFHCVFTETAGNGAPAAPGLFHANQSHGIGPPGALAQLAESRLVAGHLNIPVG